jgi:glycosyltransferase involved in cell wall biosynthesis
MNPLVSVVMPVYNGEQYLQDAIESILRQTFSDFEYIIVDDGSTDKSLALIKAYQDRRIRLIRNECNQGVTISLNIGLAMSRGKYIARMDADEISFPERFAKQVAFLNAHPDVGVLGANVQLIDPHGSPSDVWRYPVAHCAILWALHFLNPFAHPATMLRKEVVNQVGGYNSKRTEPHAEDYELWVHISGITRFANLDEVLLYHRIHTENYSDIYSDAHRKDDLAITHMLVAQTLGYDISDELALQCRRFYQDAWAINNVYPVTRLFYQLCQAFLRATPFHRREQQLLRDDTAQRLLDVVLCKRVRGLQQWHVLALAWWLSPGMFVQKLGRTLHKRILHAKKLRKE